MGAMHTAILVEPGKIITFGCNKSGQLGRGNLRNYSSPAVVKSMGDRIITVNLTNCSCDTIFMFKIFIK